MPNGRLFLLAITALAAQAQPRQADPSIPTFGTTVIANAGFRGDIYFLKPGSKKLPKFRRLKPVGSIYTTRLNVPPTDFSAGFPGVTDRFEWFAIDYNGRFWVDAPGTYRFALLSDDGSKLYIDGKQVIDNDGVHAQIRKQNSASLTSGPHTIHVEYFQGPRFHVALQLTVAKADSDWRVFDMDEFKPPPDAADAAYGVSGGSEATKKK